MRRVEAGADWTLMCPNDCPGLADVWGPEFDSLYERYEAAGKGRRTVAAQALWFAVLEAQMETGVPYMLFKDACNAKSNQQNLGTIRSSNLCTEIVEFTSPTETAVCNLASLALPRFVVDDAAPPPAAAAAGGGPAGEPAAPVSGRPFGASTRLAGSLGAASRRFDHAAFAAVARHATRNLNRIIDVNYYPVETARRSNLRHRPIGLGVQGLADVFMLLGLPFDSPEAAALNRDIFETLYFAALTESATLAEEEGTYETYPGCPASKGVLQQDMWGLGAQDAGSRHDWAALRARVAATGLRNSLLVAPMPTASTSQILGAWGGARPLRLLILTPFPHPQNCPPVLRRQQRVLRAVHQQHLRPAGAFGRVHGREPAPAGGPHLPRPLVTRPQKRAHRRQRLRRHPARRARQAEGGVQDGVGDQAGAQPDQPSGMLRRAMIYLPALPPKQIPSPPPAPLPSAHCGGHGG